MVLLWGEDRKVQGASVLMLLFTVAQGSLWLGSYEGQRSIVSWVALTIERFLLMGALALLTIGETK